VCSTRRLDLGILQTRDHQLQSKPTQLRADVMTQFFRKHPHFSRKLMMYNDNAFLE
jgi:hypothetical protein